MPVRPLSALIVLPLVLGCQCVQIPGNVCFDDDKMCDAGGAGGAGGGAGGTGGGSEMPGFLTSISPDLDFEQVEVGTTADRIWLITNAGQTPTGVPVVTGGGPELKATGCPGPLAPGASCSVKLSFTPTANTPTAFQAIATATANPGGTRNVNLTARVMFRLDVTMEKNGAGSEVSSSDGGISCFASCTALIEKGASLTLNARTQNGSSTRFLLWVPQTPTDGGVLCAGSARDKTGHGCVIASMKEHSQVTARFAQTTKNLVFVSSKPFSANLGGLDGGDAKCNELASEAGINTDGGDGFVAWLSSPGSPAAARIPPTAGGFMRMDGEPLALTRAGLLSNQILLALYIDEQGNHRQRDPLGIAWTGTNADGGSAATTCLGWTTANAGMGQVGLIEGGPGQWTNSEQANCSQTALLYCLQTTSREPIVIPPPPAGAKFIYSTTGVGFRPTDAGLGAADAYCLNHRPAAHASSNFVAFVATSAASAVERITSGSPYYRTDGLFVGYKISLGAGPVAAVPWLRNDGTYGTGVTVWSGAPSALVPASGGNCNNWTSNTGMGTVTELGPSWFAGKPVTCGAPQELLCIEP